MMNRRTTRIVAIILAVIVGATALLGYDVFLGRNITETFFEPNKE
jgi:hypothetical protein